jgi:hypothetical protein
MEKEPDTPPFARTGSRFWLLEFDSANISSAGVYRPQTALLQSNRPFWSTIAPLLLTRRTLAFDRARREIPAKV